MYMNELEKSRNTVDVARESQLKLFELFGINSELLWRIKKEGKDIDKIIVDTMKQQNELLLKLKELYEYSEPESNGIIVIRKSKRQKMTIEERYEYNINKFIERLKEFKQINYKMQGIYYEAHYSAKHYGFDELSEILVNLKEQCLDHIQIYNKYIKELRSRLTSEPESSPSEAGSSP